MLKNYLIMEWVYFLMKLNNEAQKMSPLLVKWLEKIRVELGFSQMTYARTLIYATPDGKGTAAHFDQNINFVYQIQGTKIWRMARNTDVINPLTRHTMGTLPDHEIMGNMEAPLPTSMPKSVETYELRPGSLLFVPQFIYKSLLQNLLQNYAITFSLSTRRVSR